MRLIDADELKARVKKASDAVVGNNVTYNAIRMTMNTVLLAIDVSPTITPDNTDEPDFTTIYMVGYEDAKKKYTPKHGHWRIEPYLIGTTHRCSRCGENYGMPHEIYKYCPNCGAIMKNNGDDDDE